MISKKFSVNNFKKRSLKYPKRIQDISNTFKYKVDYEFIFFT